MRKTLLTLLLIPVILLAWSDVSMAGGIDRSPPGKEPTILAADLTHGYSGQLTEISALKVAPVIHYQDNQLPAVNYQDALASVLVPAPAQDIWLPGNQSAMPDRPNYYTVLLTTTRQADQPGKPVGFDHPLLE